MRKVSFPSCGPAPIDSSSPCSNPSLRSSRVATACARFARWKPGGRPPSLIEGWDPVKHEYPATVAGGCWCWWGRMRLSPDRCIPRLITVLLLFSLGRSEIHIRTSSVICKTRRLVYPMVVVFLFSYMLYCFPLSLFSLK